MTRFVFRREHRDHRMKANTKGALKLAGFAALAGAGSLMIYGCVGFIRVIGDKEASVELQRIQSHMANTVPQRVLVSHDNRWTRYAFVAEPSSATPGQLRVLILNDHYRGSDPTYRWPSGIIHTQEELSADLLCTLPEQARKIDFTIDPFALGYIQKRCRTAR